jgi:DNA-binding HxlR family transcriptional regulator
MHWVASQVPELVDGSNTEVLAWVGDKWTVLIVSVLRMGHFEITR